MSERFLYEVGDLIGIERLSDIIVGPILERRDRGLNRRVAGHHDDDEVRIDFVHASLEFNAVGAAHFDVTKCCVPRFFGHFGQSAVRVFSGADFVSLFMKPFGQRVAHAQFVVHDE